MIFKTLVKNIYMLPQIDRHFAYCPRVVPGHCISCPWGQMDCPGDNGTMQRSSAGRVDGGWMKGGWWVDEGGWWVDEGWIF